jgi:hypothetical protein
MFAFLEAGRGSLPAEAKVWRSKSDAGYLSGSCSYYVALARLMTNGPQIWPTEQFKACIVHFAICIGSCKLFWLSQCKLVQGPALLSCSWHCKACRDIQERYGTLMPKVLRRMLLLSVKSGKGRLFACAQELLSSGGSELMPNTEAPMSVSRDSDKTM